MSDETLQKLYDAAIKGFIPLLMLCAALFVGREMLNRAFDLIENQNQFLQTQIVGSIVRAKTRSAATNEIIHENRERLMIIDRHVEEIQKHFIKRKAP